MERPVEELYNQAQDLLEIVRWADALLGVTPAG